MVQRLPFLLLALLISAATVFMAQQWIHGQLAGRAAGRSSSAAGAAPAHPSVQVLVAKAELPAGSILKADSLRWQDWPRDDVDSAYIVQGQGKGADFAGAVARSPLMPGEPITAARVARPGDRGAMAVVLARGHRAVTINVTPATGMAGFLAPGDRVDLILSMVIQPADKTASPRHVSETVLTDLRVLGSDQKLVDDQKEITAPKTVTLEVTPKQAEIVAVVSEMGLLSISLRSPAADAAPAPPAITRTWDKDAIDLRAPASMAKGDSRAQPRVIVVRGSEVSEVAMGATGAAAVKP